MSLSKIALKQEIACLKATLEAARKNFDDQKVEIERLQGLLNHTGKVDRKRNVEVLAALGKTSPTNPEEHYIPPVTLAQQVRGAGAEIERLRAIVDKLPRTKDGVPIFGGETVFYESPHLIPKKVCRYRVLANQSAEATDAPWVLCGPPDVVPVELCYSTREAAEAGGE